MRNLLVTTLAFTVAACGSVSACVTGAATTAAGIANSPVTVTWVPGFVHGSSSVTIAPDGTAIMTYDTAPPQTSAVKLRADLVSKLRRDIAAAMPLSALPHVSSWNPYVVISAHGQKTPNIAGAKTGIEAALLADVQSVSEAFPGPKR